MLPKPPSPLVMGYPLGQPSRSSPATPGGPLPRTLRSNVSTVCPLPSSGATPAACWLPAMAATRSPAPWPRCPPRRRVHPHSARSSSRESTHCAGLRRVGYDPGGLRGKPLWRLPVGLLLSSSGGCSLWAPRLRLCVFSLVAVAGCTTGSPRPFRCPPSLRDAVPGLCLLLGGSVPRLCGLAHPLFGVSLLLLMVASV